MANRYFMGGTSAKGFQTSFQDIISEPGYFTYILKGGPGTGKSTLMKKIIEHFSGADMDMYYCSSDIKSLDAVVLREQRTIVVDGTAPHVFNADYPGISQSIVNLGAYWDREKLAANEREIRVCFEANAGYHRRARSFVSALSGVNDSILASGKAALKSNETASIAADLASYLPDELKTGSCSYKQLGAITTEGYITQEKAPELSEFGIHDPYYAASFEILGQLKALLLKRGHDIIVSECHIFGQSRTEHIIVPGHSLQISAVNPLNKLDFTMSLSCEELYSDLDSEETARAFDIVGQLERETADSIARALEIHDRLESFYIDAQDFEKLDQVTQELIEEIEGRPW